MAAFTALNITVEFYRESLPPSLSPDEELANLRRTGQRYRQLRDVLAAEDMPDAKTVCFVINIFTVELRIEAAR